MGESFRKRSVTYADKFLNSFFIKKMMQEKDGVNFFPFKGLWLKSKFLDFENNPEL